MSFKITLLSNAGRRQESHFFFMNTDPVVGIVQVELQKIFLGSIEMGVSAELVDCSRQEPNCLWGPGP